MSDRNRRVELRAMQAEELPFVLSAESAPHASPFINRWSEAQHAAALADPDIAHYVIVAPGDHDVVGFVLLAGLRGPDHALELRRIVVTTPGHGIGRAAIRRVKRLAFEALRCERLWLDVKPENLRARALYASEGFREERRAPASEFEGAQPAPLIVMSLERVAWTR